MPYSSLLLLLLLLLQIFLEVAGVHCNGVGNCGAAASAIAALRLRL